MHPVLVVASRLLKETEGQDLLEYAILSTLIALVAIAGVTSVGNTISGVLWQTIAQNF